MALINEQREAERPIRLRERSGDDVEKEERKIEHEKRMREELTTKLQRLYRSYRARQRMVEIALKLIVRRFDPGSGQFYFSNLRTGQSSWSKPRLFGEQEPEALDEWVECVDPNGDKYIYNPKLEEMKWPDEAVYAEKHSPKRARED